MLIGVPKEIKVREYPSYGTRQCARVGGARSRSDCRS